jgi:hypothetical protein
MLAIPTLLPEGGGAGLLLLVLFPYPLLVLLPLLHENNSRLPPKSNMTIFSACLVFIVFF